MTIEIHPLTPDRWPDLVALFQTNAVTRDCWCMWFRQTGAEFTANRKEPNKRAFKRIVDRSDVPPGLIAYVDDEPAGWCALAPRDEYPRVQRARAMKPIDDRPAWAISCFFVRRTARGRGVTKALLREAVAFARRHGATLIEGYPVDTSAGRVTPDAAYHGTLRLFEGAGFTEVARHDKRRPIVRKRVRKPSRAQET
jgi:GNAT superfamily N-acetyltransferase